MIGTTGTGLGYFNGRHRGDECDAGTIEGSLRDMGGRWRERRAKREDARPHRISPGMGVDGRQDNMLLTVYVYGLLAMSMLS